MNAPARATRKGLGLLARAIGLVTAAVAAVLVVGILLVVFEANRDNGIVDALLEAARFLAGPFRDIFDLENRKTEVAVNWGIAAAVYVVVGRLVARLLRR